MHNTVAGGGVRKHNWGTHTASQQCQFSGAWVWWPMHVAKCMCVCGGCAVYHRCYVWTLCVPAAVTHYLTHTHTHSNMCPPMQCCCSVWAVTQKSALLRSITTYIHWLLLLLLRHHSSSLLSSRSSSSSSDPTRLDLRTRSCRSSSCCCCSSTPSAPAASCMPSSSPSCSSPSAYPVS